MLWKSLVACAALGLVFAPSVSVAGEQNHFVTIDETAASRSDSAGSECFQVLVTGGDAAGNVLVVSDRSPGARHELKFQVEGDRIVVQAEPDPDRPWLGVLLAPEDGGIRVSSVMDGSPADRAGLLAGDLLTRVGDRDVTGEGEQDDVLAGLVPGDDVRLTVQRDGGTERLSAQLGQHPGKVEFPLAEGLGPLQIAGDLLGGLQGLRRLDSLKGLEVLPFFDCQGDDCPLGSFSFSLSTRKPRLGVVLEELSPQLARFFEVEPGQGMLIQEILEGSVAERAGLSAGDVLMRIDDTDVSSVHDIRQALAPVGKGQSVRIEVMRRGSRESFRAELDSDTPAARGSGASFGLSEGALRFALPSVGPEVDWTSEGASYSSPLPHAEDRRRLEQALAEAASRRRALREKEIGRVEEPAGDSTATEGSQLLRHREEAERTF